MMGLWSTVQQAASIFCCCVITYKPLFTQLGIFSRLSSWIASYGSRSQQTKSKKSDMDPRMDTSHGWIDLEDSRSPHRGFVSTDIVASKPDSQHRDEEPYSGTDLGHQMKTVQVEQVVNRV